ncbi:MAG TPA: PGPGW domain-containing protein [Burkholderiales bacterium]|nr:PGPGW domain-containing protein [Burkholderiales bacterium]
MTAHAYSRSGAFGRLKRQWRDLAAARPGNRFQQRYARRQQARRSRFSGPLTITAGVLIALCGLVLLPAPGPGMIVVLIGASLIAEESRAAARALDWSEVHARRAIRSASRTWEKASISVKALILLATGISAGILAWIAYAVFVS